MNQAKETVQNFFKLADVKIDGKRPWDLTVHNERFYRRVVVDGTLGLGESYMDGDWDCQQIDEMISRVLKAQLDKKVKKSPALLFFILKQKVTNIASKKRAFKVGEQHYDLGNELYENMLDPDLNYSCGYWKNAKTLHAAQIAKIDLICKKLYLKEGMRVLDIGSGWGNFAKFAARKYKVEVVGITVSKEQAALAQKRCKGLPVKFNVMDYRDLEGEKFDRIVSIGMFEHVNYKNHETFMRVSERMLKDDGLFLLHTIGSRDTKLSNDPWMHKYIFPNSKVPSLAQIAKACEQKFVIEDVHNFGFYYYPTLMNWLKNFDKNWEGLSQKYPDKYDARFYRMWKYYLMICAGGFKSRGLQLFQVVISKGVRPEVYQSIR